MDQLIVTKWKDRSLTALLSDGHCRSLTLESGDESLLGNIYIGKVKNVVKNINAAFIDLGGGKTGYFSLAENPVPLYTDELNQLCSLEYSENSEKKVSPRKLKAGDELLVQVSRRRPENQGSVRDLLSEFSGYLYGSDGWKTADWIFGKNQG